VSEECCVCVCVCVCVFLKNIWVFASSFLRILESSRLNAHVGILSFFLSCFESKSVCTFFKKKRKDCSSLDEDLDLSILEI